MIELKIRVYGINANAEEVREAVADGASFTPNVTTVEVVEPGFWGRHERKFWWVFLVISMSISWIRADGFQWDGAPWWYWAGVLLIPAMIFGGLFWTLQRNRNQRRSVR